MPIVVKVGCQLRFWFPRLRRLWGKRRLTPYQVKNIMRRVLKECPYGDQFDEGARLLDEIEGLRSEV